MTDAERLEGCIIGGAIGDAWGSAFEHLPQQNDKKTFFLKVIKQSVPVWSFTDDTQLTLITLEALANAVKLSPDTLANAFVYYYKKRELKGIGASTLKALQELEAGGHWSQVGRGGEFGAGNGAAMRIAPFAFWDTYTREEIRNFCRITHRNDEAYVGGLAVITAIQQARNRKWIETSDLIEQIVPHLPDTRVRDRLIELDKVDNSIAEAAKFGTSGYVVNSVPFAIFCASQVQKIGIEKMYQDIIDSGGDTDTNASIAGQIAGSIIGIKAIPSTLTQKLKNIQGYEWLVEILGNTVNKLNGYTGINL